MQDRQQPPSPAAFTTAQVVAHAEQQLAHHRSLAAGFVAKARHDAGHAICVQHAKCVDTVRSYGAEVAGLIGLCQALGDGAAAERIRTVAEATETALIDQAYRCRMLRLPGWADTPAALAHEAVAA